ALCARCRQGWQEGAGAQIAVDAAAVDRALCDAQHIGSLDGPEPERAHQDVPPSTVRFVWRRDGGRCRVDGCRSARGLELHHIVHRADGGGHDALNLVILCSACHLAHHRGTLTVTGTADHLEVHRPGQAASLKDARQPSTGAPSATKAGTHTDATLRSTGAARSCGDSVNTTPLIHDAPDPAEPDPSSSLADRIPGAHVGAVKAAVAIANADDTNTV